MTSFDMTGACLASTLPGSLLNCSLPSARPPSTRLSPPGSPFRSRPAILRPPPSWGLGPPYLRYRMSPSRPVDCASAWLCCQRTSFQRQHSSRPTRLPPFAHVFSPSSPFHLSSRSCRARCPPPMSPQWSSLLPASGCRQGGLPPRCSRERRPCTKAHVLPRVEFAANGGVSRIEGRVRRRRPGVRFPADETWDPVSLGMLQRNVMPVRPLLDGSSAVVAALPQRTWRETGRTPFRPYHSGGLRAPPRASHTSSTALSAATLSSSEKQALSRVDLFRVIGVQAQPTENMAVAAAVPGVPSARVRA